MSSYIELLSDRDSNFGGYTCTTTTLFLLLPHTTNATFRTAKMALLNFLKKEKNAKAATDDGLPSTSSSEQTNEVTNTTNGTTMEPTHTSSGTNELTRQESNTRNKMGKITTADIAAERIDYPHGLKLFAIIGSLMAAVFLVALDQTIISTAIPKITDDFNSITDIGWYGSSYLLTATAFQPTYGKIYTIFSIKWVFLMAIGVFELGSLICAVAPSSAVLIVGRAIAGIGVGGIFSGGTVILAYTRE